MTGSDPIDQLGRRVSALEAEHFALLEQLRRVSDTAERNARALDDLEDALVELSTGDPGARPDDDAMTAALTQRQAQLAADHTGIAPPARPGLAELQAWVQAQLAPLVRKTTTTGEGGGIRWCRQWWEHPDAVERFTALYLARQQLSTEDSPTWLSVYLRDHLDPHLATLTSPHGPFHACTPRKHSTAIEALGQAELATTPPPGSQQP